MTMWPWRVGVRRRPGDMSSNTKVYQRFRAQVPEGARPGDEFQVNVSGRIVRVRCPDGCVAGESIMFKIEVPNYSPYEDIGSGVPLAPAPPQEVVTENTTQQRASSPRTSFTDTMTTTPPHSPAQSPPQSPAQSPQQRQSNRKSTQSRKSEEFQTFEVTVPPNVTPGAPFALVAGGTRVLVTCPLGASPGNKIRFSIPIRKAPDVMLRYKNNQWTRAVRVSDYKFQWTRLDGDGNIEPPNATFDPEKTAYVRKLRFHSNSPVRSGSLSLVPASDAVTDASIKTRCGTEVVTYSEIASAQSKDFNEKVKWFSDICGKKLSVKWSEGHMRLNVRRANLLSDSMHSVMSMSRTDMRKTWRLQFIGEDAIDAGGVAREWFELVFQQLFDPNRGLFVTSTSNQACVSINTASEYCSEDHLDCFRFAGRMLGKALFDRQLVKGHFIQLIYKHILGWPIQLRDLESFGEDYYKSLKSLGDMVQHGMDLSDLMTDFTVTQDVFGAKEVVELIPGGSDVLLSNENLPEYFDACLKYRLFGMFEPQLRELLLGFYDVIPEPLMAIFDFQELELLMCGLPDIDLGDWQRNTEYTGEYAAEKGSNLQSIKWFWEIVAEFGLEKKARLLQFVTGTSGVPAAGFGLLQGVDGNIRKFSIQVVPATGRNVYPRAHTCFNRIDLPDFASKEEMREKLDFVVTMAATGFGLE